MDKKCANLNIFQNAPRAPPRSETHQEVFIFMGINFRECAVFAYFASINLRICPKFLKLVPEKNNIGKNFFTWKFIFWKYFFAARDENHPETEKTVYHIFFAGKNRFYFPTITLESQEQLIF